MGQFGFHPLFGSPEKTEYFEYRHMGENPFFRRLPVQAKFPAVDCESLTPTRGATQQSVGIKRKRKEGGKGSKSRSVPQQRGTKSEVAASPLPSRGPKRGRKCYVTPAFSGCTTEGEGNKSGPRRAPGKNPMVGVLNKKKLVLKDHPASPSQWSCPKSFGPSRCLLSCEKGQTIPRGLPPI